MIKVDMHAHTVGARMRLAKLEKSIEKAGQATVKQLVEAGKAHAQMLVPKRTLFLYRSIKGRVVNGQRPKGEIFIEPVNTPWSERGFQGRGPGKYGPNGFSLVRWMHTASRARTGKHFSTRTARQIRFMYSTRDYLKAKKMAIVNANYSGIKLKK
jgi:hypothetical protein